MGESSYYKDGDNGEDALDEEVLYLIPEEGLIEKNFIANSEGEGRYLGINLLPPHKAEKVVSL